MSLRSSLQNKERMDEIYQSDETESIETVFLGVVTSENSTDVWQKPIAVNSEQILFKLDTGAAICTQRGATVFSASLRKRCVALATRQYS